MTNLAGCRVLVVDDEPFMRMTIRAVLRAVDRFDVREADGGDSGLVLCEEFKPDVVLCDISMPRMGGLEFVAQLRRHPEQGMRDTPVIILTGYAAEATVHDAVKLQISGFLVKPVSPKSMGTYLKKILGDRQPIPRT
jgi:two-component system, chemotaxis family, chemotaxis protein CheY